MSSLKIRLSDNTEVHTAVWQQRAIGSAVFSEKNKNIPASDHLHQPQGNPSLHCLTFAFPFPALKDEDSWGIYGHCLKMWS